MMTNSKIESKKKMKCKTKSMEKMCGRKKEIVKCLCKRARKLLAQKLRGHLDTRPESCPVEKFYIYWTVLGRRFDEALLANAAKLETMRSLWMSNYSVSFEACKLLSPKLPGFNVEFIDERGHLDTRPESCPDEKLHIYRKVSGRRLDTPNFVWIIKQDVSLTPYCSFTFWSCMVELCCIIHCEKDRMTVEKNIA
ncbi:Protein TRANSPORT INHIBITOR RESPONSE 1 [Capsicum baccatum]|uniref:Protein TRANSPORT INHIBITOR RESPONSE 1 n=1 Tax=Capsicum baccatum TaxID=33114 RepID=A0A2G2WH63_CAPBA|nr:Protein TRANSPORT INHIBITOR RESPONSE 1 [Capsicum baccatum]